MQPSIFNLRVPISGRDDVFLMNTLTDAQLVVSSDVAALLDRPADSDSTELDEEQREAMKLLATNGFFVSDRETERRAL